MIDLTKLGRVTSEYGARVNPVTGAKENHNGIDIVLNSDYIPVIDSGTVIESSYHTARGYYVVVKHAGGITSLYQHLATRSKYHKGDKVVEGDTIGLQGASGMVTGKHLHFEVKKNNTLVDPRSIMSGGSTVTDMKHDDVDKETAEQKNAGGLAWWGDIVKVVIMALLVLAGAGLLVAGIYGGIKK